MRPARAPYLGAGARGDLSINTIVEMAHGLFNTEMPSRREEWARLRAGNVFAHQLPALREASFVYDVPLALIAAHTLHDGAAIPAGRLQAVWAALDLSTATPSVPPLAVESTLGGPRRGRVHTGKAPSIAAVITATARGDISACV